MTSVPLAAKMLDFLKSYGYIPSRVYLLLRSLEETPDNMSLSRQMSLMWRGYVPRHVQHYNLDDYNLDDYLSLLEKEKMAFEIDSEDAHNLDNKRLFFLILESIHTEFQLPELYGAGEVTSVLQSKELVAKPKDGKCGVGVRVLSNPSDLRESDLTNNNTLFMEKMEPPEWMPTYQDGLGTLRLFTLDGRVTGAIVRLPTEDSYPVDNWSNGGMIAGVDLETGKINQVYTRDQDNEIVETTSHPDTGETVMGVEVPHFDQAVCEVESLTGEFPSARVIGWDLVSYENEIVILEANRNPNLEMMQLFRPARFSYERS